MAPRSRSVEKHARASSAAPSVCVCDSYLEEWWNRWGHAQLKRRVRERFGDWARWDPQALFDHPANDGFRGMLSITRKYAQDELVQALQPRWWWLGLDAPGIVEMLPQPIVDGPSRMWIHIPYRRVPTAALVALLALLRRASIVAFCLTLMHAAWLVSSSAPAPLPL
jgi:hypothetical protein